LPHVGDRLDPPPHFATTSGELEGKSFTIEIDGATRTGRVTQSDPGIDWMHAFWFAWAAFNPETSIHPTR